LEKSRRIIGEEQGCSSCSTEEIDPYQPINDTSVTDLTISKVIPEKVIESCIVRKTIPNDDIVVKKEVVSLIKKKPLKNVGIQKYGRKAWAPNFKFHSSRTRDSLRMRADSSAFKKLYSL